MGRSICPRGAALCAVILFGVSARAHEIGTTRVSVRVQEDRSCSIEVVTDAAALVDKLEASSGRSSSIGMPAARLQAALQSMDETFRGRLSIAFDGSKFRSAIAYSVTPGADGSTAPAAIIRLTGRIPSNARHFTWSYGWTFASYAITVRGTGSQNAQTQWLEGGEVSAPFALEPPPAMHRPEIVWRYLVLGFTHILPKGLDHMLFVLGIYLLSGRTRSVLTQVSAFTVAHSITLGLSMYGVITLSPKVVEPLIALSIAYVAIENIILSELKSWRIALVFAFGLLHGMGFAGALKELGLPRRDFIVALVSFNTGVEAGQLAVIAAAFLLVGWHFAGRAWYRSGVVVPASALIAATAVYWTFQRLSA